ncbi:acyl-CoA reductase [Gaopeijia maritima]|uniref:acyl-CoA reductase n=1 Tax=Gaopeijia maritima TaxID=3119007 RepID=UPI0032470B27
MKPPTPADGEPLEAVVERLSRAAGPLRATRWRDRVRVLGRVGARFLDPDDPLRRTALEQLPDSAALSPEQARWVLEGMARDWTERRLETLVATEFEMPDALDRWVDDPRAPEGRRVRVFPLAPGFALHIASGSVPGVSTTSMLRSLLVGCPVLLKPGRGDRLLPDLFLRGLEEEAGVATTARALADAAVCRVWAGGAGSPDEERALRAAGAVVVYGGLDTVADLRRRLPATTPVVEYGHRLSLAVVGDRPEPELPARLAAAVAAFDQRGCVCPHRVYALGGAVAARALAERVAEALDALADDVPQGPTDLGVASAVQQLRGTLHLRAAAGEDVAVHEGVDARWTVAVDPDPVFAPSCLGRTIVITPLADLADLDEILAPVGPVLQTVGVDGFEPDRLDALAERVGRLGASRVVPVAHMAFPPAWWLHDGQGPLRRLVRWAARGEF